MLIRRVFWGKLCFGHVTIRDSATNFSEDNNMSLVGMIESGANLDNMILTLISKMKPFLNLKKKKKKRMKRLSLYRKFVGINYHE